MSGILPEDVEDAASRASSLAIAEYFKSGGSADDTSAGGKSLLHLVLSAMIGHRLETGVRAVLAGRPRNVDARWFGRTPLHKAVGASLTNLYSQLEIIDMLLDAGADIDARTSGPSAGRAGHTPLMLAAQAQGRSARKYEIIRLLLTRGARLDLRDDAGADVAAILAASGRPIGLQFRRTVASLHGTPEEADESYQRALDLDYAKATTLLADVGAAGGTWARYLHEPRVRLDVLRILLARGRAMPPVRRRTRRRSGKDLVPCLFTELPADVFRHAIGFWRSDRDD